MDTEIIGMGLRFPKAQSPLQFWQNLVNEQEGIQSLPKGPILLQGNKNDITSMC